jgi:preprotein translocase subunit SecA
LSCSCCLPRGGLPPVGRRQITLLVSRLAQTSISGSTTKLIEERNYSLLGRKLAHDDVEKRLRSVIRRHRNELAIAVAFAQRAMPQIEEVVTTIERMYLPAGAELPIV